MRRYGIHIIVQAVAVAGVLGGAELAAACTPQARLSTGSHSAGPSGTEVNVIGSEFGAGVVEIRWNSKGGVKLGDATGPTFSVDVTVPESPPGVHYLVAFQTVGSATASVAFEVIEAPESTGSPAASRPTGRTSTRADAAEEPPSEGGSVAGGPDTTPLSSQSGDRPSRSAGGGEGAVVAESAGQRAQDEEPTTGSRQSEREAEGRPTAVAQVPRPKPVSDNAAAVREPSGNVVFGASAAPPPQLATVGAGDDVSAPHVSAATVAGDTWSGFGSPVRPSLVNPVESPSAGGSSSPPFLGVGLLASGLAALFTGFGVAEARRNRVLAGAARN